jgi:hypothetical protein
VKFRFLILHEEECVITGTDSLITAQAFLNDEHHMVVDTELNTYHLGGENADILPEDERFK